MTGITLRTNPTLITGSVITTGTAVYGSTAAVWTLTNQGTLAGTGAGGYGVFLAGSGTVANDAGGTITGGGSGIFIYGPGQVVNSGTIEETAATYGFGIYLENGGAVTNSAGGVVEGYYGVSLHGGTVDNAGTIAGTGGADIAVNFAPAAVASLLVIETTSVIDGSIAGFSQGVTIELAGQVATRESFANGTLSLYGPSGLITTLQLDEPSPTTSADFTLHNAAGNSFITPDVKCFTAGTRIATPRGEIAVEALAAGDTVRTAAGARPIILAARFTAEIDPANPARYAPIRIKPGALGHGTPQRDLFVSPDHAMLLDGFLVPARLLLNGITITQPPRRGRVDYFHLELAPHEVIFAEGAATESYLDTNTFPRPGITSQLASKTWDDACAPLLLHGAPLVRIQAAITALIPDDVAERLAG